MAAGYELIARQFVEARDVLAVVSARESWTYSELEARAEQIATQLRAAGVGPGQRVAISLDRGGPFVATTLAVWRLGACFVPFDPSYPGPRLAAMLTDCDPSVLVASPPPAWARTARCRIVEPSPITAGPPPPVAVVDDLDPAYLIYTSGSTGSPKGVVVAHRGLAGLVAAQRDVFGVGRGDRVLQFASLGFDATISELVVTLASGATLIVPDGAQRRSPTELTRLMRETKVAIATFPPSILEVLSPEALPDLRTVVTAGEPCPLYVVQAWAPGRRFINAYGPTEATVCATMAVLAADTETIVIGRAIPTATLHLIGPDGSEVANGEIGEIAIGGSGVARGYWNKPAVTAEVFTPDPFSAEPGAVCYRTGDLGRWKGADLEFLGRRDHQLKIAGYRIEPGDVEAAIRAVAETERCLVFAIQPPGHAKELAVALVGSRVSERVLRSRLGERLPAFMVPSRVLLLSDWPVTPNGKVDRARLESLALQSANVVPDRENSRRGTPEEDVLALWRDELGRDAGLDGDFYELGGSSLKLMRLLAALEHRFGIALPMSELLAGPLTARRMMDLIDTAARSTPEGQLRFHQSAPGIPIFLVPPVVGEPLVFATLARGLRGHPVFALRPPGLAEGETPIDNVLSLAQYFATFVRAEARGRPVVIGGYSIGGMSAYELAGLLHETGVDVRCLLLIEAPAPMSDEERAKDTIPSTAVLARMCAHFLATTVGQTTVLDPAVLSQLSDDEIHARFRSELIRIGLATEHLPVANAVRRLALFRTNLRAHRQYPGRQFSGRAGMIWSEEGHPFAKGNAVLFDWSRFLQPVAERRVPGNHFTILSAQHVAHTSAAIESIIAELA